LAIGAAWTSQASGRTTIGPYDMASIMSYDNDCKSYDPDTIRFGSTGLSPFDFVGSVTIYRAPATGDRDVGVLAGEVGCGANEAITVYMDAEDSNPATSASGWTGISQVDRNVWLEFCRTDGTAFQAAAQPYAVLQLGPSCPDGAKSAEVFIDNEDDGNENYVSGLIAPGKQDRNTTLRLCAFDAKSGAAASFPDLGYQYGVFGGPAAMGNPGFGTGDMGSMFIDDENSDNADKITVAGAAANPAALVNHGIQQIVGNTLFFFVRVK
jgi:hypothetical protein